MVVYKWNWGNKPKEVEESWGILFCTDVGTVLWTNEHLFGELCNLFVRPGLRHFNTKTDVSLWLYCYIILLFIRYLFYFPEHRQTLQYWFGHVWTNDCIFPTNKGFSRSTCSFQACIRQSFDLNSIQLLLLNCHTRWAPSRSFYKSSYGAPTNGRT